MVPVMTPARTRQLRLLLAPFLLHSRCTSDRIPEPPIPPVSLTEARGADDPGSCAACHPRQFAEWVGSSHNYGGGLDPTYQALELVANYVQRHRAGGPRVRQNLLCMSCHAPSAAGHIGGVLNPNATFRPAPMDGTVVGREIARPANEEDLLLPAGRATEEQVASDLDAIALAARRRLTYQGITCDSCHKVGRPFDDLNDEEVGQVCRERTPECAAMLRAQCEVRDDPRCRRVSRGGDPHGEDRFEVGIANLAIAYEREGSTRYGPFVAGDVAPNTAHAVSAGATPEAASFVVSFDREESLDERPYLRTAQFCAACHDVRLPIDNPNTPAVELEPIHEEPFIRLENLFTEWFTSPLNLHPSRDVRDNPYLDENGKPKRVVCQDCHMSLFPFAPPGTFPGEYTAAAAECDELGRCGSTIALAELGGVPTTYYSLRVLNRPRVATHNMTGVDIGLGHVAPTRDLLGLSPTQELPGSVALPNQVATPGSDRDTSYGLPVSLDARRRQQLHNAATISLAGTPAVIDAGDRDCSDGLCCDGRGECNLPVKAWIMNVNGGHHVASGFSQERQVWVELTVQDLGRVDPTTGLAHVVDCALGEMTDLYLAESLEKDRYPRFLDPVPHSAESAGDVLNRFFGIETGSVAADHEQICRGLSGHLIDKPHHETQEIEADGRLDDEDVLLHRIGNTLPEFEDGRRLVSWHILDLGLDVEGDARKVRVARDDQFHVVGNDPFAAELNRLEPNMEFLDQPVVTLDPATGRTSTVALRTLGALKWRVTDTSDERLEILYPFPEIEFLLPHINSAGNLEPGDRFGLAYPTNIFYRIAGCPFPGGATCEGPEDLDGMHAQVHWLMTYPTLPHANEAGNDALHFPGNRTLFAPLLQRLGMSGGTPATEAFTFVPLNANHMPNNRALTFYSPQRHYWDIRFRLGEVVGPIRIAVKLWYRHFPPEFLRLMARSSRQAYDRAEREGRAAELFPQGPLVVEGRRDSARWPMAGDVDAVSRIILDEAVSYVAVNPAQESHPGLAVPDTPSFQRDVRPILRDHCVPCHGDVLRHGGLVLDYDEFPEWDDPKRGPKVHEAQDARLNLVERPSRFLSDRTLVVPGDPDRSFLVRVLSDSSPDPGSERRVRRMPLKMDPIAAREIAVIRRWIEKGSPP